MITLKFPRHHSMSMKNQSSTNQSSYRHLLLPLAVCTGLELISTHSPHSRIGTGFLTYFMLIWMLRIVHTDHGSVICQDEKKEQTMMQTVFCWVPLCFGLVWFLLDSHLLCLPCRRPHFYT